MKTGIELIAEERREQIEDAEQYQKNELIDAAMYAVTKERKYYPETWDFWFHNKMMDKEKRMSEQEFWIERLKIAGALIAAEIDRVSKR